MVHVTNTFLAVQSLDTLEQNVLCPHTETWINFFSVQTQFRWYTHHVAVVRAAYERWFRCCTHISAHTVHILILACVHIILQELLEWPRAPIYKPAATLAARFQRWQCQPETVGWLLWFKQKYLSYWLIECNRILCRHSWGGWIVMTFMTLYVFLFLS